jgi:hypothetical protein
MRSTTAVAVLLVLLLGLTGCGMGDRTAGGAPKVTTTEDSSGDVDAADLAAAMLLNAYDVGASVGATTRLTAHLDDVSACAVSSGAEASRIAAVARTWRPRTGGQVSQVLATFPPGTGAAVFKALRADKSGRSCVRPAPGFHRELGQVVAAVPAGDQSAWCYVVLADKGRGKVCTTYVRRGDVITGVQTLGTDARMVKLVTAQLAALAFIRVGSS